MNKYTNSEITNFVKQLSKVDAKIWDALVACEGLVCSQMFRDVIRNRHTDEGKMLINEIAARAEKYMTSDSFASPETSGAYFQDYEQFADLIGSEMA